MIYCAEPVSDAGRPRTHVELEGDVVGILDAQRSAVIGVHNLAMGDSDSIKVPRPLDNRLPIDAGESHVIETKPGGIERPGGRSRVLGETDGKPGYRAKDASYNDSPVRVPTEGLPHSVS